MLQVFDVETGFDNTLLNMNPGGWIPGVSNERTWVMLYGMDVNAERQIIIAGDSKGKVYFVDARTNAEVAQCQLHKKGNKARHNWSSCHALTCLQAYMSFLSSTSILRGNCVKGSLFWLLHKFI